MFGYDAQDDALRTEMAALQVAPSARDENWMKKRRDAHSNRMQTLKDRRAEKKDDELSFAKVIREMLAKHATHQKAVDAVQLAEFTQKALARLRAKEEGEELRERLEQRPGAKGEEGPAAASGSGDGEHDAKALYQTFFFPDSGKKDGASGTTHAELAMEPGQEEWTDEQWAKHFLKVGGFEPSGAGASAEDKDGWLALHHAIQATVHWSNGIAACRGLIAMMSTDRLRAKTRAGRPSGYTALHLAANGSDKLFQRASIVELLLERGAEVDGTDDKGRTPLHHAAGTGVVDAAQVLIARRADLAAMDMNGKNALDKCKFSSGRMFKCPPPSLLLPQPA